MDTLKFSIDRIELIEEISKYQFAKVKLYAFASGNNAHNMPVNENSLQRCAKTIYDKPLVWILNKKGDDASGHSPLEVPCGFVYRENNPVEFVRLDDGRLMLTVYALIWKKYCGKILSFFERDGGEKPVSVEIQVIETQKNDTGAVEIIDFVFAGITILGSDVEPAVENAKALIIEFSKYKKQYQLNFMASRYKDLDFTIPKGVKEEAQEGLDLRKEYGRGGTSVGMATARYLVKNTVASPEKVRHIAKYFPRHAGDNLDQVDPPSNGRIAWKLWGGDSGRRWSNKLVNAMSKIDEKEMSAEVMSDNFANTNKIKEEDEMKKFNKVEFAKISNMTAREMSDMLYKECSQVKYGEEGYSKFAMLDYCGEFVYAYDYECNKTMAVPYSMENGKPSMDFAGAKPCRMAYVVEIEVEDEPEEGQEEVEETDALMAFANTLVKEKENKLNETILKLENEITEFGNTVANLNLTVKELTNEKESLKQFKSNIEEQQKKDQIDFAIQSVSEKLSQVQIDEWRKKASEYENIQHFTDAIKAYAFDLSVGKEPDSKSFSRVGIPKQTDSLDKKNSSVWDRL